MARKEKIVKVPPIHSVSFDLNGLTESGKKLIKGTHAVSPLDKNKTLCSLDIHDNVYDAEPEIKTERIRVTCDSCAKIIHYCKQNSTDARIIRKDD